MIEYKDNCLIMPYWQFAERFPDLRAQCITFDDVPAQEMERYTVILHLDEARRPETVAFLKPNEVRRICHD